RGDLTITWSTDHVANEEDAGIFAFERNDGGKKALVVLNTSDKQMSETSTIQTGGNPMTTSFAAGTELTDVLQLDGSAATSTLTVGPGGTLTVPVAARGAKIYVPSGDVVP